MSREGGIRYRRRAAG